MTSQDKEYSSQQQQEEIWDDETNWVDAEESSLATKEEKQSVISSSVVSLGAPITMVETAFLASTASLIWLINYYFPLGPVLRIFFPIPVALVSLRRGNRAAWMAALVSGLLLSVLMGPTRSILFVMPYGLMGVQLGYMWRRGASWISSILLGTILGSFGFFFRFWLLSIFLGEDLWVYVITQITEIADWLFLQLGILAQPNMLLIQVIALVVITFSNLVYLFVVHLIALLVLDKLGNPIPRPPHWVQVILDYEQ
ncbi:MAG: DUF2232 domain-containing protein [Spirulinaceae cyanobacterium]